MAPKLIYYLFLLRLTSIFGISLDTFVECKIKNGGISKIKVEPDWSPIGAQRFIDLVKDKFYDGAALFRCQKDITVQFGIPKSREQMKKWHKIGNIKADPRRSDLFEQSHWKQGLLSFAGGGTDSRGGQIFVTLRDKKLISKRMEWIGIVLFSLPALIWTIDVTARILPYWTGGITTDFLI